MAFVVDSYGVKRAVIKDKDISESQIQFLASYFQFMEDEMPTVSLLLENYEQCTFICA